MPLTAFVNEADYILECLLAKLSGESQSKCDLQASIAFGRVCLPYIHDLQSTHIEYG